MGYMYRKGTVAEANEATKRNLERARALSEPTVTVKVHKPRGLDYGEKTKPTVASQRKPLTKRQRKRRNQLARKNAARRAERQAYRDMFTAMSEIIHDTRAQAQELEHERGRIAERLAKLRQD